MQYSIYHHPDININPRREKKLSSIKTEMDKFCLKWNDFQTSVTNSFSKLRKDDDFYDVTLVSDDDQFNRGHKLVLASSSDFFKKIFKVTKQAESIVYLTGINQKNLNFIMEYIYLGEVQIYQEDIDSFLESAQKLRIEGLISDQSENEADVKQDISDDQRESIPFPPDHGNEEESCQLAEQSDKVLHKRGPYHTPASTHSNYSQSKEVFDEFIMKDGELWVCRQCGKTAKTKASIGLHAETHIEGISFDCKLCDKIFRSRNSLAKHKTRTHRKI